MSRSTNHLRILDGSKDRYDCTSIYILEEYNNNWSLTQPNDLFTDLHRDAVLAQYLALMLTNDIDTILVAIRFNTYGLFGMC